MGGGGGGGRFSGTKGSQPTLKKGAQDKHIKGTPNYKQEVAKGKPPSILTDKNPQKLLDEGAGKGIRPSPNSNKEIVDYGRSIGEFYDAKKGKYVDTTRGTIHYDSKGQAHIVPARPH